MNNIVIGAGVFGLSSALSLLEEGEDVTVIELGSEIPCRVSSDPHERCNDLDTVSERGSVK